MNQLYLVILSLVGFVVSFYIYYTKTYNKKLHCIFGENCDAVVKSRYGKTFGIENTVPGMIYYALVFLYGLGIVLNRNVFKRMTTNLNDKNS